MASESAASAGDSYIGSFISLISKYEIRYEGTLYHLNVKDSTIGLRNVRSFGTEGRKKDGGQVPPSEKVYEYILFRGSDIKDLQVKSSPPARTEEQIHNDPAIFQTHSAGVPASSTPLASVKRNSLTESPQWQDTPALTSRGHPGTLSSYQSAAQLPQPELSPLTQTTTYQQGSDGTSISPFHPPQHHVSSQPQSVMSDPLTRQQLLQAPEILASTTLGSANISEPRTPVSSSPPSTSVNPKFLLSPSLVQYSTTSLDVPSSLPTLTSLPSHSTSLTANTLTMSSFPSSGQDLIENQVVHKAVSESVPVPVLPAHSVPYPASPLLGSNLRPLLTQSPILLTPDQSALPGPHMLPSPQKLYPNQNDMGALLTISPNLSSSFHTPVTQAPLLPLPTAPRQTVQFTEEFDFTAMNEKFKKDEVWGYLGKAKPMDKAEGPEENVAVRHLEERDGQGLITDPKPAYKKDDFFDTISCNSLSRGRGAIHGQHRFSERMKQDTETFGIQQRPNLGYGGYGAERGKNFRGGINWGRGFGYGGRGLGGNMPF
ncbi:Lsm14- DFDF- FFD- domain containing protein [Parasponia andersonii]|uniref:Lsm14-DFDF-FFD-domain containing protein n=1 Tax=Parasponia andersonii TaxID=3476 RepID=A0A2P5B9Q8_PARAD|nr:Lsm14- DFDF- FFD- domain containing protein [Parasponia andersonii]